LCHVSDAPLQKLVRLAVSDIGTQETDSPSGHTREAKYGSQHSGFAGSISTNDARNTRSGYSKRNAPKYVHIGDVACGYVVKA
jgi:hypothetical protein